MTSNASALTARPNDFELTRRHVAIAFAVVVLTGMAVLLYRERAIEVQLVMPQYEDIESTVSATGSVIPTNDFAARATFSGIVDNISAHLGQRVHRGQKLLQLRDQFANARVNSARAGLLAAELNGENVRSNGSREDQIAQASELAKAENEQAAAAKSLATIQQLRKLGSTSDAEVIAAKERLDTANAAFAAAKQRSQTRYSIQDLKSSEAKIEAQKANLAGEQVSYRNANVISPIEGTVYLLPVKRYDFVQMGADLVRVADLKKLSVRANFYEPDIRQLKTGEPVRITWPMGAPGREWSGRIEAKPMAVTGDGVLRTGLCTVDITSDTDDLPVNTSVTVTATVQKHSHVMTLPREALHDEGTKHFVFRVEGGRLEKATVEIGLVNAMRAEITKGIRKDDQIAVHSEGGETLRSGVRVKRQGAG